MTDKRKGMKSLKIVFVCLLIAASSLLVFGQQLDGSDDQNPQRDGNQKIRLLRELGLSREQIQKIRFINQETRPQKLKAAQRLRDARQELDSAIYADKADETNLRNLISDVVEAQSEITKINALHEIKVRQVLTTAQLTRFREMRETFASRSRIPADRRNDDNQRRQRRNRPGVNALKP